MENYNFPVLFIIAESFVVNLLFSNLKLARKATVFRTFEINSRLRDRGEKYAINEGRI